ncbi:Unknown protein, partial [Striga hermonthica]
SEKRDYVLDKAPPPPPEDQTSDEYGEYLRHTDDNLQARCYMLASMLNELQRQNELLNNASEILLHLQELYGDRTQQIRYQISKELFRCRMTEGSSVHDHGLKMIALVESLSFLGVIMDNELYVDLMLQSLPSSFDSFVVNFNMHNMETSLPELVNMLKTAESTIKKDKPVLLVGSTSGSKALKSKKRKGKGKVPNKPNKKANNNKGKNKEKVNSQSNYDQTTSRGDNHGPIPSTSRANTTMIPDLATLMQNPEFAKGFSTLLAQTMPGTSRTVPGQSLAPITPAIPTAPPLQQGVNNQTRSHATSQPRDYAQTVNPKEQNLQEMTAESESGHVQRETAVARPLFRPAGNLVDLRHQIVRGRTARHDNPEMEALRRR